jgi:hypothetical protein
MYFNDYVFIFQLTYCFNINLHYTKDILQNKLPTS